MMLHYIFRQSLPKNPVLATCAAAAALLSEHRVVEALPSSVFARLDLMTASTVLARAGCTGALPSASAFRIVVSDSSAVCFWHRVGLRWRSCKALMSPHC